MAYAWLLAAYPRDYRREHGAELLEPLLVESRRPTGREVANLVVHGLRTRLGRPASRAVVAWALVVTAIAGVLGAAFGTWAGRQTSDPLPRPEWTRALLADVVPGRPFELVEPAPPAAGWSPGESWEIADDLLGRNGELQAATAGARVRLSAGDDPEAIIGTAAERLRAAGWSVGPPDRAEGYRVEANRADLALTMRVTPAADARGSAVSVRFEQATPVAARIGGAAGGLAAAVVAFLVFAAASRRTGRPGHPARWAVTVPFGLAVLFWCPPALVALTVLASSGPYQPRAGGPPPWEWLGRPTVFVVFVVGALFAAVSLLLAALPRGREGHGRPHSAPRTT